jgi:uroporphyrinogen III methyltransferase/synthase
MTSQSPKGKVFLVGAGPGDPGLITARGLELIATADVIMHDRLVPTSLLRGARADAVIEFSGKQHSGDSAKQADIEQRILHHARAGRTVVRLKGGDPFVFGRGGEEAAELAAAGVEFEVVPGVTAGVGVAAFAGIPVTHRGHSSAVAFVTGHEDPTRTETQIDWAALAVFPGTLVFYMTVKNLARNAERLISHGLDPATPTAVIAQGTTARQRTLTGRLDEIGQKAVEAGIEPPALTVIGDVVLERERIAWFERRPLLGRSVAITGGRRSRMRLGERLEALGADVIDLPTIETSLCDSAQLGELTEDLIVFASDAAVEGFFAALGRSGRDARALAGIKLCCVGPATARSLADRGITADLVPQRQSAAGLLEALGDINGQRVLLPQAAVPRPELADGLRELGAQVTALTVYETLELKLKEHQLEQLKGADFITLMSGSAAEALLNSADEHLAPDQKLVSIGPSTSAVVHKHGHEPALEATRHDADGIVQVLIDFNADDIHDR